MLINLTNPTHCAYRNIEYGLNLRMWWAHVQHNNATGKHLTGWSSVCVSDERQLNWLRLDLTLLQPCLPQRSRCALAAVNTSWTASSSRCWTATGTASVWNAATARRSWPTSASAGATASTARRTSSSESQANHAKTNQWCRVVDSSGYTRIFAPYPIAWYTSVRQQLIQNDTKQEPPCSSKTDDVLFQCKRIFQQHKIHNIIHIFTHTFTSEL